MSGGVDSSTTAALLQKNGCTVHGVYLKLFNAKSVERAEADAKGVGSLLGIQIETIDYRQQFDEHVIRPFVEAYCTGTTPLPCALCNYYIKFDAFCEHAHRVGAQFVATGHYAIKKCINGVSALCPANDKRRDQSYFMFGISAHQLEMAVFPLGGVSSKDQVRQYAKECGIPVAQKPDSQDICFLSEYDGCYVTFIRQYIEEQKQNRSSEVHFAKESNACGNGVHLNTEPNACGSDVRSAAESKACGSGVHSATESNIQEWAIQPGKILDANEHVVGEHQGALHYTVGQRRGLGISAPHPLYVFKIAGSNVYVGPLEQLAVQKVFLKDCNYHPLALQMLRTCEPTCEHTSEPTCECEPTCEPIRVMTQYRSAMPPVPGTFAIGADGVPVVTFDDAQYGVSPGQAEVFRMLDGTVLGGGWIERTG
jgi:tRNA-specific 2-thiouridylase